MELSGQDRIDLRRAKSLLEHQGLAVRLASSVGMPLEKVLAALPDGASHLINSATTRSLNAAMRTAVRLMDDRPRPAADRLHTIAAAASGAAGGAFGLAALAAELPASTTIMLRSIAAIARSEGQSIRSARVQLACLEVFALGGPTRSDDASESGYFAVRAALATAVTEAAEHVALRGMSAEAAPALVRLIARIAARFGIPVTQKVMAQSVPIIGAAGGAMVNVLFIRHFQDVARGHFTVRRIEQTYGHEAVKAAYLSM